MQNIHEKEKDDPNRVTLKTGVENNFIESSVTYSFLKEIIFSMGMCRFLYLCASWAFLVHREARRRN